jgi:hypothetical protein
MLTRSARITGAKSMSLQQTSKVTKTWTLSLLLAVCVGSLAASCLMIGKQKALVCPLVVESSGRRSWFVAGSQLFEGNDYVHVASKRNGEAVLIRATIADDDLPVAVLDIELTANSASPLEPKVAPRLEVYDMLANTARSIEILDANVLIEVVETAAMPAGSDVPLQWQDLISVVSFEIRGTMGNVPYCAHGGILVGAG